MRTLVRAILLALLATAAAASLAAQDIRPLASTTRTGFWWGIGLGAARADVACNGCVNVDPETFPMLDIRLGGTLSRKVTLGVQVTGGSKKGAFGDPYNVTHNVGDMNVSAYYYPEADGDFWFQGGLAGVVWQGKSGGTTLHSTAGGITVGAGYDFRFGRNASVTPTLRAVFGGKGNIVDQNGNSANAEFQTTYLELGVSVLWH